MTCSTHSGFSIRRLLQTGGVIGLFYHRGHVLQSTISRPSMHSGYDYNGRTLWMSYAHIQMGTSSYI